MFSACCQTMARQAEVWGMRNRFVYYKSAFSGVFTCSCTDRILSHIFRQQVLLHNSIGKANFHKHPMENRTKKRDGKSEIVGSNRQLSGGDEQSFIHFSLCLALARQWGDERVMMGLSRSVEKIRKNFSSCHGKLWDDSLQLYTW